MAVKTQPLSTTGFKNTFMTKVLKDSIARARSRVVMDKASFYAQDFANKLTSWTVSGDLSNRAILSIQKAANTAIENGTDFAAFKRMITPEVLNNIVVPEVVYRNAINFAYQTGRFDQQDFVKAIRPFLQYVTFGDERVRPNHAIMNGTVAPFDDPFWAKNYPPNGHNCRCVARSVSERQVKKMGLEVLTDKEITARAIAEQTAKGVAKENIVLPLADKDWVGSFKVISNGAQKQVDTFGNLPKTFFSFITPDPPVVVIAPAAEVAQSQAIVSAAVEPDYSDFTNVGPQLGSNPGEQVANKAGEKFYLKFVDEDHAHNEVLANKLYGLARIEDRPVVDFVRKDGKRTVLSKWTDDLEKAKTLLTTSKVEGVADGFAADAWLSNWDAVGLSYDNMMIKEVAGKKKAFRVDQGGSLKFRAQGQPKGAAFGDKVVELKTFLDEGANKQAFEVFRNYSTADFLPGAERVGKIKSADIRKLVNAFSNGTAAEKKALADKLIARRDDVKAWAAEQKAAGKLEQKAAKTAAAEAKKAKTAADKAAKDKAIAAQKEAAAQDKAKKDALKAADKAAQEEAATTSNEVFERLKKESQEARDFERGAQKVTAKDKAKITESKSVGYNVPGDKGAIEDQQINFRETFDPSGQKVTTATFKLREKYWKKLFRDISAEEPINAPDLAPLNESLLASLRKIKVAERNGNSLGTTIANGWLEEAKTRFRAVESTLLEMVKLGNYPAQVARDFSVFYKSWIDAMEEALKPSLEKKIAPVFKKEGLFQGHVLPTPIQPEPTAKAGMKFHKKQLVPRISEFKNGEVFETDKVALGANVKPMDIILESNYKGSRIQLVTDKDAFAYTGRVSVRVEGPASRATTKIMDIIDDLGIETTAPKFADVEELYLNQMIAKFDPANVDRLLEDAAKIKDQEGRIALLKNNVNLIGKRRGLENFVVDKEPDYNPIGRREGAKGDGAIVRMAPKRLETDLGQDFDDFSRTHSLTHEALGTTEVNGIERDKDKVWDVVIDRILSSGGKYFSTLERIDRGIVTFGISPNSDVKTGGGNYCFLRIKHALNLPRTGIIYDPDKIRRLDAVSYFGDSWGNVKKANIVQRKSSTPEYKRFADISSDNETNFKGSVDFFEGLRYITVESNEIKEKVIAVLKKHGYEETLPGGRKVRDVVKLRQEINFDPKTGYK